MKQLKLLLILFPVLYLSSYAQDTIKIESSIFYSSQIHPNRGKAFASMLKCAREDIIFSATEKRVEYCYYYDDKRICFGKNYRILNDSTLEIKYDAGDTVPELWTYHKLSAERYAVSRSEGGFIEYGYASSLIPLLKMGEFITKKIDAEDALWIEKYTDSPEQREEPFYIFPKANIQGELYQDYELDQIPTTQNGDTLSILRLEYHHFCFSEPISGVRTLTFIVNKAGEIKNIEQFEGGINLASCPFYVMELMKKLSLEGPLIAGEINGEKVNSRCYIQVDMMNDGATENAKHPAYNRVRLPAKAERTAAQRRRLYKKMNKN